MPDISARLSLPYLMPSQAQKHVTHNEALLRLDLLVQLTVEDYSANTPPALPEDGQIWGLGAAPSGAWAGHPDELAAWVDGNWYFVEPVAGWRAANAGTGEVRVWNGTGWTPQDLTGLEGVGINTGYDSTNRLSVSAPATLLNHEGAGHQLKLNKAQSTDTASLLFQTGFSGRAEMGTNGTDAFSIKLSDDGSVWTTGLSFDGATGIPSAPEGLSVNGAITGTAITQSDEDTTTGRLIKVGDGGLLGDAVDVAGPAALHTRNLKGGTYVAVASVTGGLPESTAYWHTMMLNKRSGGFFSGLSIRNTGNPSAQRAWFGSGANDTTPMIWTELWHRANTTVDTNGFIKEASPIVRLFDTGTEEPAEPVEAEFARVGTGQYSLSGVNPLATRGWQIEVPQDANGNRLVFVETRYDTEARVLHVQTSAVAWDGRWVAGEAIDIPDGRWIDLRFATPEGQDAQAADAE